MTYHTTSTSGSSPASSSSSSSSSSRPTTTTTTTTMTTSTAPSASRVAPPGYHYMPDGTLMSDIDHAKLYSHSASKKYSDIILAKDIHTLEKEYKISLNKSPVNPLTYGDLKNIPKDPIIPDLLTEFTMNCVIEKIPVPKVNRVLGLSITPKNTISKNAVLYIDRYNNEVYMPENYINSNGVGMGVIISGDLKAEYDLVIKDVTNSKWYNWNTEEFENGYNSLSGVVDYTPKYATIPPQTSETKYQLFFKPIGSTDYLEELPTEENPWDIYQLKKATTTFQFNDTINDLFIPETTSSVIYNPGVEINKGSTNDGKVDITITVLPKRGTIELLQAAVNIENIIPSDGNTIDPTEIISTELTASINSSGSIGTITGTAVLGKSSLRDSIYMIDPNNFFKIV